MGDGGVAGGPGVSDAAQDSSCTPVMIDHQGETTGCVPDLQEPDCPVAAAESCAETACRTGCSDFYLCTDDGWRAVAYCDEQGQIVMTP